MTVLFRGLYEYSQRFNMPSYNGKVTQKFNGFVLLGESTRIASSSGSRLFFVFCCIVILLSSWAPAEFFVEKGQIFGWSS